MNLLKNYLPWLVFLLITIIIAFGIDTSTRCKEVEVLLQTERFENEQKISELKKEIRILKQDMLILQGGYENESED